MTLRRLGVLLHHDRAGRAEGGPVSAAGKRGRGEYTPAIQLRALETHDLRPGGDACNSVVERDALLLGKRRQRRRGGRR